MLRAVIESLKEFVARYRDLEVLIRLVGYPGLLGIVFAETGLLVGFFLPGRLPPVHGGVPRLRRRHGRLVPAGRAWRSRRSLGDQDGLPDRAEGGQALYRREDSRFFKRKHLIAAHEFYERYGGKTIFLARFVPIIRTFAPTVAGAAEMDYRKFVFYNVAGGISWVCAMVGGGYLLGQRFPGLKKHIEWVVLGIIFVSVLPIAWEAWKARRRGQEAAEKTLASGPEADEEARRAS